MVNPVTIPKENAATWGISAPHTRAVVRFCNRAHLRPGHIAPVCYYAPCSRASRSRFTDGTAPVLRYALQISS